MDNTANVSIILSNNDNLEGLVVQGELSKDASNSKMQKVVILIY